jgi:CBS domain-containing protein
MTTYQVKEWMTPNPITVDADNNLSVAYQLLRLNRVRRLPVIGHSGKLVGIITWGDIREARPKGSLAEQTGSEWETHFLAATMEVRAIMTPDPVTVTPDCSVRLAASLMLDHKIGGLPVVVDEAVVGMITESDLFRFLVRNFPADSAQPEAGAP